MNEQTVRNESTCRGCGQHKDRGCVACWACFKGRNGRPAFKYYAGTLEQYLRDYPPQAATIK